MENLTKPKIWEGKKKAFLVCDESLKNSDAPFYEFLRSEGYTYGTYKGSFGCPWVHVDITTKQYAYGMPGVELVGAIGGHAININEFMTIYNTYKKYEGLSVLKMPEQEQTTNDGQTLEKIWDVIKDIDPDSKKIRLSLGVVDYDAPYLLHYDVSLHLPPFCDAKNKIFDFLIRVDMLQTITILEQKR